MALLFESLYYDVIAFTVTTLVAVYWWLSSKYSYWSSRGVPGPKPQLFFGNVKDLALRRTFRGKMYQKIYNDLEGNRFGGMYFLIKPVLLLRDPELIKAVLVKDFANFHDRPFGVSSKKDPLSFNLVSLTGQSWKSLRSKLTPTFTSGKMKIMCNAMLQCAHELTNNMKSLIDGEGCAEVKEMSARFTTDVVGSCVFGLQSDAITNPDSVFRKMGMQFTSPSLRVFINMVLLKFLPAFVQKIFNAFKNREREVFFYKLVEDNVKLREENNIARNDFLQLLIEIRNKERDEKASVCNGSNSTAKALNGNIHRAEDKESQVYDFEFDDKIMAAQCIIFFVAGFETSSTTMSFCLYELALNPVVQDKLRHEIDTTLELHGGRLMYDALQQMKFLDHVVDETLRKHPPAGSLGRKCTKPYVIPGTKLVVEEGTNVQVPIYALHYDVKYYPDPEKFDPDRFTQENKNKRPNYTYLPFGEGPRMCIGMRFGLLQAKVGLASLISKFIFTPCSRTQVPLRYETSSIVTTAKGGLWLQVTQRMENKN